MPKRSFNRLYVVDRKGISLKFTTKPQLRKRERELRSLLLAAQNRIAKERHRMDVEQKELDLVTELLLLKS